MSMNSLLCMGLVCMFYCVVDACITYLCFYVCLCACGCINVIGFSLVSPYLFFFQGKEHYVIVT